MSNIATLIAGLRHWQIFLLTVLPLTAISYFAMPTIDQNTDIAELQIEFTRGMVLSVPFFALIYLWMWSTGFVSNRAIEPELRPSSRLFNLSLPYVPVYIAFAAVFFTKAVLSRNPPIPMAVIVPLHLLAVAVMLYAMFFVAKNLTMVERLSLGKVRSMVLVLFMLWLLPFGIWFIQPRVNAVVEHRAPAN